MSEIRYDMLHDTYVVIAPDRLTRPNLFPAHSAALKDTTACPFCAGHESMTPPEIFVLKDVKGRWRTRVVPNLYKALAIEATDERKEEGIYEKIDGFGAHEIIVDTPEHVTDFDELSAVQMTDWLLTMRQRGNDLKKDSRLHYFTLFKNQGKNAGSTLPHVHTQLIALPVVPRKELQVLKHLYAYYREHGRSMFKDIVDYEREQKTRVVDESEHFLAYAPYGSQFAFEVIIMPKIELSDIGSCHDSLLAEAASLLKKVLSGLRRELREFDYNIYIQNPPFQKAYETEAFFDDIKNFYRFYIRVIPRLYQTGGFELQSSMTINPLAPEKAAGLLR
ncbi:galactose-1-phosphate uridylyltransferase [Sulfurovum sp. NBC37-1]|uniref:galactose-1-phosphate uridylyltransferase n=1 Tax=Sulfurovum sp. (strain NBC37-1) TaxID=387093 RepID=UPI0001587BA4|nr:galactose-1-phosphate uridylyltransferase [Sulfurovum sp. NBC37-1]BAF72225.1 galactose-1-phosphate uridylyltransferase [Sulfurovum sp. NBC37-1]